jgi:hypothetical protein
VKGVRIQQKLADGIILDYLGSESDWRDSRQSGKPFQCDGGTALGWCLRPVPTRGT